MKRSLHIFFISFLAMNQWPALAQDDSRLWHDKERKVHYLPAGNDFICADPVRRFNRALYGTNTAFRVEAGDLPEFAMYMPGMGGNLRLALQNGNRHKWLIQADHIKTRYRAGSMIYEIRDSILGKAVLHLSVLALSDAEGMVVRISTEGALPAVSLVWVYGGASGKKFSRDGDIGADPESSFDLKPEYCLDNRYQLAEGKFVLNYGTGKVLTEGERYEIQTVPDSALKGEIPKESRQITGIYPSASVIKLIDPSRLELAFNSLEPVLPRYCITGKYPLTDKEEYILLYNSATQVNDSPGQAFQKAEAARAILAGRIQVYTPDPYLNTLGGALAMAADAIWEAPTYMHGAVAWRMRLPGWRGPYVADPLGWHDRARMHFDAYSKSQLTKPPVTGVVMDTALNLARHLEKVGTQLFSEGYITRNPDGYTGAHHYDMNLVYIDQLLIHFHYTGDTAYVKKMWPLLKRHLAWEKKNFDADGDGLYDAYAAIWASDALQYSGGGVTHSSAYNYRANREAAELARLIGEDGTEYAKEAAKILDAINRNLWMPESGSYAEYKDLLGKKLVHPSAGLWTIYHAMDSKVPDPFQAYQSLRYIDRMIPHIPIQAKGWKEKGLYLLSETDWQPYTWSLNNVAFAENLHTALAYWQGGRDEEAFQLWRSAILETMYLSAGPGNFEQLSFYDAMRGELYRDFADGIGMTARTLLEGLFGIHPDALHDSLQIQPGLPHYWNLASISTPDIELKFKRTTLKETWTLKQKTNQIHQVELLLPASYDNIAALLVNNKPAKWEPVSGHFGKPKLRLRLPAAAELTIVITWSGNKMPVAKPVIHTPSGKGFTFQFPRQKILGIRDPESAMFNPKSTGSRLNGHPCHFAGSSDFFCLLKQGVFEWWQPVELDVQYDFSKLVKINWDLKYPPVPVHFTSVDLTNLFNDSVTAIFKNKYRAPRPVSPTLQLPLQGIGNWAYHSVTANIDDSGLRARAADSGKIVFNQVPYATTAKKGEKNIIFTSMWDNYPQTVTIPVGGKAKIAHLMMAGSTNPMQSRITNGLVICNYTDGTADTLALQNPENWWPIEQDYYKDDFAFQFIDDKAGRVLLKTGELMEADYQYSSIRGFTNYAIDGGAATLIDFYIDEKKEIKNFVLLAHANDVVIGLMSLTLEY